MGPAGLQHGVELVGLIMVTANVLAGLNRKQFDGECMILVKDLIYRIMLVGAGEPYHVASDRACNQ